MVKMMKGETGHRPTRAMEREDESLAPKISSSTTESTAWKNPAIKLLLLGYNKPYFL